MLHDDIESKKQVYKRTLIDGVFYAVVDCGKTDQADIVPARRSIRVRAVRKRTAREAAHEEEMALQVTRYSAVAIKEGHKDIFLCKY